MVMAATARVARVGYVATAAQAASMIVTLNIIGVRVPARSSQRPKRTLVSIGSAVKSAEIRPTSALLAPRSSPTIGTASRLPARTAFCRLPIRMVAISRDRPPGGGPAAAVRSLKAERLGFSTGGVLGMRAASRYIRTGPLAGGPGRP